MNWLPPSCLYGRYLKYDPFRYGLLFGRSASSAAVPGLATGIGSESCRRIPGSGAGFIGTSSAASSSSADCVALWNSSNCARPLSSISGPREDLPARASKTPCTFLCFTSRDMPGGSILEVLEIGAAGCWGGTYGIKLDPLMPSSIAAVFVRVIAAGGGLQPGSAPVGRIELFMVGARVAGAEAVVLVVKNGDGSGGRDVIPSSCSCSTSSTRPFSLMSFEYLAVGLLSTVRREQQHSALTREFLF
jgi:hypothetical protein